MKYELTHSQKLIYDMEKFAGGTISVICGSMLLDEMYTIEQLCVAAKELYRLNDALRIRITESSDGAYQTVGEYSEFDIECLHFNNIDEFQEYANAFVHIPIDMSGNLCEVKIVMLPDKCGILIKLHHIIGDAWTLSLLGNQFAAILKGEKPESYSYIDHIESDAKYLQSPRYDKDKSFFTEQFKKCDEVVYISEKRSDSFNASRKDFVVSGVDAKRITDYVNINSTSAYILFMTALAVYLYRTKQNIERFYIGTPILNRFNIKERNTAGMFINTIPMLIELDEKKSFLENLQHVQSEAFAFFRHQKYNYGDMLKDIRSEFGFSEKLYDCMLSYQNAQVSEGETHWYHSGMQTESLQIHIDDRDNEGIFHINYDYLTEKFSEHDVEMLHAHLMTILLGAIDDDTKKPYELPILTTDEKQRLLYVFNDTAVDFPKDKCIHTIFEEQAAKMPDKTAIVACDATLSYAEVNEMANRIAHRLIENGVQKGDIVAFILSRKSYLIPAMLGILKSGAAFLPIDPSYPDDRVQYLLTEGNVCFRIDESNINEYITSADSANPNIDITIADRFCALHTSGSTGKPKLTLLNHGNLLNFMYANSDFWDNVDTVISVTICTFDAFMQDSILSLAMGIKVVLASEEQIFNQTEFEKMFEAEENVLFFSTPTKLMAYIKQSKTAGFLRKIHSLIVGGEIFTDELYEILSEKMGNGTARNGYGPAETTMGISYDDVLPPPHKNKVFNIYGPTEGTILVSKH